MAGQRDSSLARIGRRRSLRHWQVAADGAARMPPALLSETTQLARGLRRSIDRVLAQSDDLYAPLPATPGSEWIWRPEVMRALLSPPGRASVPNDSGFGQGLKLFHDSATGEVSLRQRKSSAGFDLLLEVYRFEGSFLSLVIDLPPEGHLRLGASHILGITARMTQERPTAIYTRLNLRCGPNTETQTRQAEPDAEGGLNVDFDLSHMGLGAEPVEGAWIDLMFEAPDMNAFALSDLTLSRRPAAQF